MPLLIPIGLDPVAFSLGGIEIRWYGIFVALSILTALLIARAGARRAGLAMALVDDAALWVGLSALIGGRLLYLGCPADGSSGLARVRPPLSTSSATRRSASACSSCATTWSSSPA